MQIKTRCKTTAAVNNNSFITFVLSFYPIMVELLVQNWNQLVPFFKRLDYVLEE